MNKLFMLLLILGGIYAILFLHQEMVNKKICECIWIIEGSNQANQHYGINPKYIQCDTKQSCEQICLNTVRNTKIRFKNQTKEIDFNTFLAKRYCPYNWEIWLKNLKYYLKEE